MINHGFKQEIKKSDVTEKNGAFFCGQASLKRFRGVWILNLFGSREQMAYPHGALARNLINDTALNFFVKKINNAISNNYLFKQFPLLKYPALKVIDWFFVEPLIDNLSKEEKNVIKAFTHGARIKCEVLEKGWVVPDVGQLFLAKLFNNNSIIQAPTFRPFSGFGCSSLVFNRSKSANGALIHARNLDYDSFGFFDKYPVIIYYHPEKYGEMNYTSVSSLGLPTSGITASNEAGITLSLHLLMINQVSTRGKPILSITEEVIRRARTIDEAVEIIKSQKASGAWSIVLSSIKEDRACIVDVTARNLIVRKMESDKLIATNHVFDERLKKDEFSINYQYYLDSRLRYEDLEVLTKEKNTYSIQDVVNIISTHEHKNTDSGAALQKPLTGTIAKMNNIQSLVFCPEKNIVYVARPKVEGSKPLDGEYVPLPLICAGNKEPRDYSTVANITSHNTCDESVLEAHAHFRRATFEAAENGDFKRALELLNLASINCSNESEYYLMSALTAFRLAYDVTAQAQREMLDRAFGLLEKAEKCGQNDYHKNIVYLFKARYFDIVGKRTKSKIFYNMVDTTISKRLSDAATKSQGFGARYSVKMLKTISIDYIHSDLYQF